MNMTVIWPMVGVWVATGIGAYFYSAYKEKHEEKKPIKLKESVPTPTVASIADEIAKLQELQQQGILSSEEFDSLKAKLIAGHI